ncbi:hypothetical protein IJ818_03380 [bacterium]|nr:hypothetical protein [bacterium]
MISGFSNDKVNVNIRYVNLPKSMTDRFELSHDTLNVFKIRFNNVFKNEKIMYGTIAVLISLFSLLAGYTIYYIYDLYNIDSHPIQIKNEFVTDNTYGNSGLSDLDVLLNAEYGGTPDGSSIPTGMNSSNLQMPTPDGNGVSAITVPRKGRKIIEVEDDLDNSDIAIAVGEKKVMFTVSDKERTNPFVPYTNALGRTPKVNYPEPVPTIPEESDAGKVMTTTISGILYDTYNPSAIINVQGADYLVKRGDIINRFKVLNITPNTVTVQLGSNTYSAGVGEQISGKLEYNTISNLNNKFGGSSGIDRMIYNSRERL